jgi:outer membrane protein OmpA-like peptidoglycan-associated protein
MGHQPSGAHSAASTHSAAAGHGVVGHSAASTHSAAAGHGVVGHSAASAHLSSAGVRHVVIRAAKTGVATAKIAVAGGMLMASVVVGGDIALNRTTTSPHPCGTVELTANNNVSFTTNTANFRDPEGARQTLEKLAATLRDPQEQAEVIGTTASDGPVAERIALSLRRAKAVKAALVSLGVPADHLTTKGVGTKWSGHVPDIGPNGVLLPGPAAQNRKVVIEMSCRKR